jgi:polysaccharide export outer membrane protein
MRFALAFLIIVSALSRAEAFQQLKEQEQEREASENPSAIVRSGNYVLGPSDEIVILALDAEEIANKPIRISTSGDINLPMIGRLHVAGMTVEDLEIELRQRLKAYIVNPEVAVNITQFRSQPVSIIGHVGSPGVIQLEGRKTLIEVLSMVGGLRADAGSEIRITRKSEWGRIPLVSAVMDPNGNHSIATVNYRSIIDASHPEENIQIFPFDVISVARADVVYVIGEVRRPGGFVLNDKQSISILQVLAQAEGLAPTASPQNSKIIRPIPGANRIEIAVNLKDLLQGKIKDMTLQPEDILFVPDSYAKGALRRTLDAALQATTGLILYRAW